MRESLGRLGSKFRAMVLTSNVRRAVLNSMTVSTTRRESSAFTGFTLIVDEISAMKRFGTSSLLLPLQYDFEVG